MPVRRPVPLVPIRVTMLSVFLTTLPLRPLDVLLLCTSTVRPTRAPAASLFRLRTTTLVSRPVVLLRTLPCPVLLLIEDDRFPAFMLRPIRDLVLLPPVSRTPVVDSRTTVLLAPAALVAEPLPPPIVRPMRDLTLETAPLLPPLATRTSLLTLTERLPLERIVPVARPNELDLMVLLPWLRDIDERD